jgi:hypothetical protein
MRRLSDPLAVTNVLFCVKGCGATMVHKQQIGLQIEQRVGLFSHIHFDIVSGDEKWVLISDSLKRRATAFDHLNCNFAVAAPAPIVY